MISYEENGITVLVRNERETISLLFDYPIDQYPHQIFRIYAERFGQTEEKSAPLVVTPGEPEPRQIRAVEGQLVCESRGERFIHDGRVLTRVKLSDMPDGTYQFEIVAKGYWADFWDLDSEPAVLGPIRIETLSDLGAVAIDAPPEEVTA